MTPKEKANELINKFGHAVRFDETSEGYFVNMHSVKECALIAVEQVRFFHESLFYVNDGSLFDDYLNKVKHEIEKQVNNEIEKL
jgi:hypothetical protein